MSLVEQGLTEVERNKESCDQSVRDSLLRMENDWVRYYKMDRCVREPVWAPSVEVEDHSYRHPHAILRSLTGHSCSHHSPSPKKSEQVFSFPGEQDDRSSGGHPSKFSLSPTNANKKRSGASSANISFKNQTHQASSDSQKANPSFMPQGKYGSVGKGGHLPDTKVVIERRHDDHHEHGSDGCGAATGIQLLHKAERLESDQASVIEGKEPEHPHGQFTDSKRGNPGATSGFLHEMQHQSSQNRQQTSQHGGKLARELEASKKGKVKPVKIKDVKSTLATNDSSTEPGWRNTDPTYSSLKVLNGMQPASSNSTGNIKFTDTGKRVPGDSKFKILDSLAYDSPAAKGAGQAGADQASLSRGNSASVPKKSEAHKTLDRSGSLHQKSAKSIMRDLLPRKPSIGEMYNPSKSNILPEGSRGLSSASKAPGLKFDFGRKPSKLITANTLDLMSQGSPSPRKPESNPFEGRKQGLIQILDSGPGHSASNSTANGLQMGQLSPIKNNAEHRIPDYGDRLGLPVTRPESAQSNSQKSQRALDITLGDSPGRTRGWKSPPKGPHKGGNSALNTSMSAVLKSLIKGEKKVVWSLLVRPTSAT